VSRPVNIIRRAGTYHFRRVVPPRLRDRIHRRELIRSLKTATPAAAKLRADVLFRASERLFAAAASPMLSKEHLARLVQDFYGLVLEIDDHHRLFVGPLTENDRCWHATYLEDLTTEYRDALARNLFQNADAAATVVMARNGLSAGTLAPGEHNQIRQAILRAGIDLSKALRARYDGDFTYEPQDKFLKAKLATLTPALNVSGDASNGHLSSPEVTLSAGPPLSEAGKGFRAEQIATSVWDRQTAAQAGASYRLFLEVCGDKPLAAYTRADADTFRKQIQRLPADYAKASRYKGFMVPEIVAAYEAVTPSTPLITQKTVKRHFSALSALWASALPAGMVGQNIFSGFRFAAAKRVSEQRAMWTREELAQLFASPVWSGCKSETRRTEPGPLIIRDERFWLPVIAVFSGMRQEEICQLHVEDVRETEGIWYFDLNDRPPRTLKNENASRFVPIHRELIRLSLLEDVERCRHHGEARLFPRLQPGGADGRLGHAFSKWFTRYRRDVGLYRPGLDFHSFRHTATTLMHQAGVERAVIDHVTGHATPGETSRYTKGSRLGQLRDAIERIDLCFDVAASGTRVGGAPKVIAARRWNSRVKFKPAGGRR